MCRKKDHCYCILLERSVRKPALPLPLKNACSSFQTWLVIFVSLNTLCSIHSLLSASLSLRSCSCCTLHGLGNRRWNDVCNLSDPPSQSRHIMTSYDIIFATFVACVTFVYICDITSDTSWNSTWLRCWSSSRLRAASSRAVRSSCCH